MRLDFLRRGTAARHVAAASRPFRLTGKVSRTKPDVYDYGASYGVRLVDHSRCLCVHYNYLLLSLLLVFLSLLLLSIINAGMCVWASENINTDAVSLEDRVPDNPLDDEGGEHSSKKCESESTAEADTLWGPKNNMPEYDCPSIPRDAFTEAEILLYEEVRETRVVYICTICIFRIFSYICD
eukprot:GHVU01224484.1.p1 GENE.GHVU01224484.1~~GHVU01224484.1.p1  ORF type:complete len:182 (-),score=1.58 GHVU01224484.1:981-1526(-)